MSDRLRPNPLRQGCKLLGDSWVNWAMYSPTLVDEDIMAGWSDPCYSGPGGEYSRRARIRRTSTRTLVTQTCGLDI